MLSCVIASLSQFQWNNAERYEQKGPIINRYITYNKAQKRYMFRWMYYMWHPINLMMTSSNSFRVTGLFSSQRRGMGDFFDLRPNKRVSKQWWAWWFKTPSHPLWRHCYVSVYMCNIWGIFNKYWLDASVPCCGITPTSMDHKVSRQVTYVS